MSQDCNVTYQMHSLAVNWMLLKTFSTFTCLLWKVTLCKPAVLPWRVHLQWYPSGSCAHLCPQSPGRYLLPSDPLPRWQESWWRTNKDKRMFLPPQKSRLRVEDMEIIFPFNQSKDNVLFVAVKLSTFVFRPDFVFCADQLFNQDQHKGLKSENASWTCVSGATSVISTYFTSFSGVPKRFFLHATWPW